MRQSLGQLERAFEEEVSRERHRRRVLRHHTAHRSQHRHRTRLEKHRNLRFAALALLITTTVVIVTVTMFQTLAWLMG